MGIEQTAADISISPDLESIVNGKRKAEYTTLEKDEICLTFIHQYGPNHALTGTKGIAFYGWAKYKGLQTKHGTDLYPNPVKFTW